MQRLVKQLWFSYLVVFLGIYYLLFCTCRCQFMRGMQVYGRYLKVDKQVCTELIIVVHSHTI